MIVVRYNKPSSSARRMAARRLFTPSFVVNVFGVGAQGVQGHHQFSGNFRAAQFGSEAA